MRSAHIVVLERNSTIQGRLETEPYEAGWATEAIWFVETLEPVGPGWSARVQISPDGLRWCDHQQPAKELGDSLTAIPGTLFGTWLRLVIEAPNPADSTRVMVTLALK